MNWSRLPICRCRKRRPICCCASNFSLSDGLILTGFKEEGSVVRVEVADSERTGLGRVTLTFNRDPLSLKSWTVLDPQAQRIQVTLVNPRYGKKLDRSLFVYVNRVRAQEGIGVRQGDRRKNSDLRV